MNERTEKAFNIRPETMPRRIVISGYYGFGNIGDEAVLAGMLASFAEAGIDADVTVLSASPAQTMSAHSGVLAVNRWNPLAVLRAVLSSDILLSGGGSLVQDATGLLSPYYYLSVLRLAQILRRRTMIYAQGVGPLFRPVVRRAAARAFSKAAAVTVRDSDSEALLCSLGVTSPVSVCADPAFVLKPDLASADSLLAGHGLDGRDFVAVSLRNWPGSSSRISALGEAIADAADELGMPIAYIPMQSPADIFLVPSLAKHRTPVVFEEIESPGAAKGLIARAGVVVGMRLHSLIFAASEAVPFVPLSYDPKVWSFASTAGIGNVPSIESTAAPELKRLIIDTWERREAQRQILAVKSVEWKSLALAPARILKDLLQT